MLRKNINIKGKVINNKEMKISQYADNTQIFLVGTEQSLRTIRLDSGTYEDTRGYFYN